MKNLKINILKGVLLMTTLVGCSDDFLAEKEDLTGVNEQVYQDPILGKAYVDYIYKLILPTNGATAFTWDLASNSSDDFTQTTDELPGEVNWNKVWAAPGTNTDANCLPYIGARMTQSIANNTYTRLRQINLFLDNIDKYGMAEADKNPLKGQMYFWRAWQYFDLVRLYGGVPLVLTAQSSIGGAEDIKIPRSSTSACIEQIVADLDMAKTLLPGKWKDNTADWGRITSGAAAAFKGRVLLTWASPMFNRTDDVARWQRAYDANVEAKALLEQNNFGLFSTGGFANGTAWENMWFTEAGNPEAVIVYGFNNSTSSNLMRNNNWERACRSKMSGGSGGIGATKQIMDAFPMKDGKAPGVSTTYPYSLQTFYKNRDPRFYKTFVYNGAPWAYAEDVNYKQFSYHWFRTAPADATVLPTGFTENLGTVNTNIYVRKAVNPKASNANAYQYSGTDYMEMRFAEVLLNLAESAIGVNKLAEGKALIAKVRERAGIESNGGTFGLGDVITRDQHFAAAINERKVEFAYESKRFWDLRRWMLFNDDFGTCTRLNQTPIEGMRRKGVFFIAQKNGANYVGTADPFVPVNGVAPVADRNPATYPAGITTYDQYLDYFYANYIKVVEKDNVDPVNTVVWKFKWYNQYYFFGFPANVLNTAIYLGQTSGWSGGTSTFDPLK